MSDTPKLAGRRVVASVSGGKDSAALSLWLTEQGIDHDRIFMDTGWEHQATYDYLRGALTKALGPITELRGRRGGMADLCRYKGMFPARTKRFCTQELKVYPAQAYLNQLQDRIGDLVNAVGIRAAESSARAKMPDWEWSDGFDCEVWRPLLQWSEQDVIDIHKRHGLIPNHLYLRGHSRVGCWPCIFARKSEIRLLAEDSMRVVLIRSLEQEIGEMARSRLARRGETFDSLGYATPTFFQTDIPGAHSSMVQIDDVIAWSKTTQGGRQYELFASAVEEGCVRWGLCDVVKP